MCLCEFIKPCFEFQRNLKRSFSNKNHTKNMNTHTHTPHHTTPHHSIPQHSTAHHSHKPIASPKRRKHFLPHNVNIQTIGSYCCFSKLILSFFVSTMIHFFCEIYWKQPAQISTHTHTIAHLFIHSFI